MEAGGRQCAHPVARRVICCLGKFDALHRGHRALVEVAAATGQPVGLLSFTGMASELGWAARQPLVAPSDRTRILAGWPGSPVELTLPFADIRGLAPSAFITLIKERCAATGLVIGTDFRGGRDRSADAEVFAAAAADQGLVVSIVAPVVDSVGQISSTRVRAGLAAGDPVLVTALLGRPHRLVGTVVHGDGRGAQIGIPTANLGLRQNQEPATGVYAAWAWLAGGRWPAALNVGHVPTAGGDRPLTVEAHLIGYAGDAYGRPLALDLVARLRGEQRFPGFPELVAQIHADVAAARTLLSAAADVASIHP
jgi:riboflavin kinase / FMN adenylyltransferase